GAYVVDKKGRVIGTASSGNALVGSYYAHLGLSDMAIVYLTTAGPSELRWLNAADAKKYGIEVEFRVNEKANYVVGPWREESGTASNPPPAPPAKTRAEDDPDGTELWGRQLARQKNTSPRFTDSGEPDEEPVAMTVKKKTNNDPMVEKSRRRSQRAHIGPAPGGPLPPAPPPPPSRDATAPPPPASGGRVLGSGLMVGSPRRARRGRA